MVRVAAVFALSILSVQVEGQSYTAFNLAHSDTPHGKDKSPPHEIYREDVKNIRVNADDIQAGSFKSKGQSFTAFADLPYDHPHLQKVTPRQEIFTKDIKYPKESIGTPQYKNPGESIGTPQYKNPRENIGTPQYKNPRESIGTPQYKNAKAGIVSLVIPEAKRIPFDRNPAFLQSGNIVEDTKLFVESAKALFKFLSWSKEAQLTFDIVFETSECLENVEDVIELMDETINLVEHNAPELLYLEAIVRNLRGVKDINKQISESAKMLRTLGHLMPALSNASPRLCISSPEDSIRSFKSLAHALIDIRNHRGITLDDTVIYHLEFSSKVLSDTATFLIKLQRSLHHFKRKCENNKRKDAAVYDTIVDILDSLADFFHVLGFEDKVADIKKQILFVKRITVCYHSTNGI